MISRFYHESHFYAALEQQLNLSPVFIKFVKTVGPLSASMPLLLHNWEEIIQIWIVALDESDEEGLLAVLEDFLPRCLPEVQRAMSEAWGGVLRQLKPEAKMLAQSVVDENAGEVQDAIACPSRKPSSIILPLLNYHLCAPPSSSGDLTPRTYTLLRRLFTALMHHVRNAENFASVGDVLVDKFISLAQGTTPFSEDDLEMLCRMMDLISIAAVMQAALLHLATVLLNASPEANPAFWMGKGREVLDTVWNTGSERALLFAISLTGSLAELGWVGWRAIGILVLP
ncbi:hypothetical protein DFH08DRAFT_985270 [Mycena albidolilacea]|uniref:Uncharacterized protein n=1 Tax=Mycena albidolilacea TaxID=1033008 RepID=A0AAD7EWB3_9AGAR|nr:hypothetical protein DFH08DRAFT_985270 [Mycena albidolilacea]